MRIAFVGKGGSGKTPLSALFSRRLARSGAPVLALPATNTDRTASVFTGPDTTHAKAFEPETDGSWPPAG